MCSFLSEGISTGGLYEKAVVRSTIVNRSVYCSGAYSSLHLQNDYELHLKQRCYAC